MWVTQRSWRLVKTCQMCHHCRCSQSFIFPSKDTDLFCLCPFCYRPPVYCTACLFWGGWPRSHFVNKAWEKEINSAVQLLGCFGHVTICSQACLLGRASPSGLCAVPVLNRSQLIKGCKTGWDSIFFLLLWHGQKLMTSAVKPYVMCVVVLLVLWVLLLLISLFVWEVFTRFVLLFCLKIHI